MARARNIKPSFFTNDELADIDPLGRILFIALWTLADFKGCVSWRTKKIKVQALPYDNCDVEKLAINLDKSGFIRFYSSENEMYVKVLEFASHQNPHKNERDKGSDIPDYSEELRQGIEIKGNKVISRLIAINPDKNGSDRADSCFLIPDSCSLIPDSLGSSELENSEPAFIKLSLNDKTEFEIFNNQIAEWEELYPRVDIHQCLRNMKGWISGNPTRRKTKTGIIKFINTWLAKEQNSGGTKRGSDATSSDEIPDFARDDYDDSKRFDKDFIDSEVT